MAVPRITGAQPPAVFLHYHPSTGFCDGPGLPAELGGGRHWSEPGGHKVGKAVLPGLPPGSMCVCEAPAAAEQAGCAFDSMLWTAAILPPSFASVLALVVATSYSHL